MEKLYFSPKETFTRQANAAKRRGIEWRLSFDEWLAIWAASGQYENRGRGRGKYCMARHGDVGPYAVGNVEIIKHEQNASDCRANHKRTTEDLALQALGKGRGWTFRRNRYQVTISGRYVGLFKHQADAEAAYRAEVSKEMKELCSRVTRNKALASPSEWGASGE